MRTHAVLAAICLFLVQGPAMAQTGTCIPKSTYHLPLDQMKLSVDVEYANISHGQVLHNAPDYRDRPNAVEYEVLSDCAATYRLDIKSAALDPRPVRILLNGAVVRDQALASATGGWDPQHQRWFEHQATLQLRKGSNRLRIERDSVFPHISEIELLLEPCESRLNP